ncbi:MAG: transposase [Oscillibacter sp.]|nr:transposase [Oscillibacter sp.]
MTLEEAAAFEGIKYNTLIQRMNRAPEGYITRLQTRENGGKSQVLLSVTSLTAKAQKAWQAKQKKDGRDVIIEKRTVEAVPWYVAADLNHYIDGHKKAYYEAVEVARVVQEFIDYAGPEKRTDLAARLAVTLGISPQSFYRYQTQVLEANAWALKLEKEDGQNRDYFRALALCRKPKTTDTFPSLPPEQRALIENIWFDKQFAANLGTREMLYEKFEEIARERGWEDYPSVKTVGRYVNYLMSTRGAASARYLAANGTREWRNKMMLKGKRDATTLEVMELLVGDEHTFDLWVQYTAPNGKVKAVRPTLVAWMDMRSRAIVGDVVCVKANGDTLKESLVKMIYTAGVPKRLLIDNGRDYTKQELTGQNRKKRNIDFGFDAETVGFYQSIGIEGVDRALPYQAWVKAVERLFGTVCSRFSKWFASYTGTLTGSKTEAKRNKDIDGMLERGELLTLEEFYDAWTEWKEQHYHTRKHRGLTEANEKWVTPGELYRRGPRYEKAAPPREYAAMLLMKADTARVYNQGIHKFGTLYTDYELCFWKDKTVQIKWDIDDVSKLYVYDQEGHKICEAVSAEVLGFGEKCSQAALEKLMRDQKRQYRDSVEVLKDFATPYEVRLEQGRPSDAVGKLELMIGHAPSSKVIALPLDRGCRGEAAARNQKKRSRAGEEFLASKAESALAKLRVINE